MARVARRTQGALVLLAAGAVLALHAGQAFVSGGRAALPRAGQAVDTRAAGVQRFGSIVQVPGDVKNGLKLLIDGNPFQIMSFASKKLGKGVGITKCKVRHLITGATVEKTLQSGQKLDSIETSWAGATYSYYDEDNNFYVFMDGETFEEMMLPKDALGGSEEWLTDGIEVDIEKYEDTFINFRFKGDIVVEVVQTTDTGREDGDQQVVLANGVTRSAPKYIKQGDMVVIDPVNFNIKKRA